MSDRPRALITGASGGIGSAVAAALTATHDLLLGGRDGSVLTALADRLAGGARPWVVDLADPAARTAAAAHVERLDVLVHSAATPEPGRVIDSSAEAWRRVLEINLVAAAELTRLLLPVLRRARGHVVFINAGSGLRNPVGRGAYAASKLGLRAFADTLRAEEEPHGVRVTSVFPGPTATELQRRAHRRSGREYRPEQLLQPGAVAAVVLAAVQAPPGAQVVDVAVERTGSAGDPPPHRPG